MSEDTGMDLSGWIKHVRLNCEHIGIARLACEDMDDAQFFRAVYHRALAGRSYHDTLLRVDDMLAAAGVRDYGTTESAVRNLIAERDRLRAALEAKEKGDG